jgi:hypothetical protein
VSTPTPTIPSFEQSAAMIATVAAISASGSTPAAKLASALVAQSVASIFQSASTGNASAINADIAALIGSIKDPGLALIAQTLATIGTPYLQAFLSAGANVPLLGASEQGILASVAAGMNQAATAYITAYSPPAAKA